MLDALLVSFGVIFVAELGDKSQLMAMTFAIRFKWWVVLLGITFATAVVHIVSVIIGLTVGSSIPSDVISIIAGISMLIFGLWTLRGDDLSDAEADLANKVTTSVFLAVASAFFLAELGDKTMLATITLGTSHEWFGTWLGSTLGMVSADALAIVIGAVLGQRLPERSIQIGAAVLFFGFAAWLLKDGLVAAGSLGVTAGVLTLCAAIVGAGVVLVRRTLRADPPVRPELAQVVK